MDRRELKDCIARLAERYGLRYFEKHKGFVGIYRGIGVNVCESGGEITLSFFCPTADIGDQILEDFAGFVHWAEAGLPSAWIEALREIDANKPTITTTSHRGCVVKIDKYRLEKIGVEKFLEIPEIVALDLYEYGATETWVCDMCKQDAATDAFLDGANAALCNRCWYKVHLAQKSKKRKSVLGPFYWTILMFGALILMSIIWGTFKEPSVKDSYNEGIEALEDSNYDIAITCFSKAIRQDPNLAPTYALRAYAYYNIGNYNAAIRDYTEAIRIAKTTPGEFPKEHTAGLYNDRGFAYLLINEYDRAIADCTKALQFKPDFDDAYINRGDAYVVKQMYDNAIADYNEAIRHEPNNSLAYYGRGFAYFGKSEYDLAIADCTEAIRLDPNLAVAYIERGVAYYRKADYDQALADFTEAIQLVPNYGAAYSERGRIYYSKKEYDKAWEDVHKAQSLGFEVPTEFLTDLREASGREKYTQKDNLCSGRPESTLQYFGTAPYHDVDVFNAPLPGFFVCGEEHVQPISTNCASAVEDLYGFAVVVAGHNHFSAERVFPVSGNEDVTPAYLVTTGRYTVCEFAAASSTRAISGYTHPHRLPLPGWFVPDFCSRLIYCGWANDVCLSSSAK